MRKYHIKYKVFMIISLLILLIGSNYMGSQSSYAMYMATREPAFKDDTKYGDAQEAIKEEKTPEDIALDKRLDDERKKNEKSYREEGRVGTSITPDKKEPQFDVRDFTGILSTIHRYMEENPDQFSAPTGNDMIKKTADPRINDSIYAERKEGIISDFKSENLIAMEVKKLDGDYSIIILGRETANDDWNILAEGDVYELRKQIAKSDE